MATKDTPSSAASPLPFSAATATSPLLLPSDDEHTCRLCEQTLRRPKVLDCLHVFCEACLLDNALSNTSDSPSNNNGDAPSNQIDVIECSVCAQRTSLSRRGVAGLLTDLTLEQIDSVENDGLDLDADNEEGVANVVVAAEDGGRRSIVCTSCKARKAAIARCADCANFLCPNCVSAHQYMRCFENHKVVSFDEMPNGELPRFLTGNATVTVACPDHPNEHLRDFCTLCQVPICPECTLGDHPHPSHPTERLSSTPDGGLQLASSGLRTLHTDATQRLASCEEAASALGGALGDAQLQRDDARSTIEETYQSFKAVLERTKDSLLRELDELHNAHQLQLIEACHDTERTAERLDDACKYTARLLQYLSASPQDRNGSNDCNSHNESNNCNVNGSNDCNTSNNMTGSTSCKVMASNDCSASNGTICNGAVCNGMCSNGCNRSGCNGSVCNAQKDTESNSSNMNGYNGRVCNGNDCKRTVCNGLVLSLHAVAGRQLTALSSVAARASADGAGAAQALLEFCAGSDVEAFGAVVRASFGRTVLKTDKSKPDSFDSETFSLPSGVLTPDPTTTGAGITGVHRAGVAITGAHRSGAGITGAHMAGTGVAITGAHGAGPGLPGAHGDSVSRSSHSPAMSDSGISVDAASTNSATSASTATSAAKLFNLASLARLSGGAQHTLCLSDSIIQLPSSNSTSTCRAVGAGSLSPSDAATLASLLNPQANPSPSSPPSDFDALVGLFHPTASAPVTSSAAADVVVTNLGNLSGLGSLGASALTSSDSELDFVSGSLSSASAVSSQSFSSNAATPQSPAPPPPPPYPPVRRCSKMSPMQIRCKFGQLGPGKGQFNSPHGFCLGLEEDIIVADTNNHRIQVFEKNGDFKYQFGIPGREEGQLWYPRKVAVIRSSGKYVVCDRGNERSRMQIFTKNGHFIKKIAIRYIDIVAGLAITQQGHIVAVDSVSPTVFCIAETGDLIKWFDCSDFMREPSDIAISGKEYFVCDFKGHCVVVFNEDGQFLRRIGCENITNYPNGIDISDAGDVLVGDSHGNRFHVAVFHGDGSLLGEFECPYVKVSRCCGLKITSEGYVVTLAKNNHHVLVLNTLYIT